MIEAWMKEKYHQKASIYICTFAHVFCMEQILCVFVCFDPFGAVVELASPTPVLFIQCQSTYG